VIIIFQSHRPVYSFEDNGDYIYDVQWSPLHPALFATADGSGRLDLWNLNNDTEVKKGALFVNISFICYSANHNSQKMLHLALFYEQINLSHFT
jgi:WD40 repeat protein